jgi:hypothetical protein
MMDEPANTLLYPPARSVRSLEHGAVWSLDVRNEESLRLAVDGAWLPLPMIAAPQLPCLNKLGIRSPFEALAEPGQGRLVNNGDLPSLA